MCFVLEKITYNLLVKISKLSEYVCETESDDLDYLRKQEFLFYDYRNNIHHYRISTKGRVAIRNYCENTKLILFDKIISIVTLVVATLTLVTTFYQFFDVCQPLGQF